MATNTTPPGSGAVITKLRKPPAKLSVRQEVALRFATAMVAGKYGESILETAGPDIPRRWARISYQLADYWLNAKEAQE